MRTEVEEPEPELEHLGKARARVFGRIHHSFNPSLQIATRSARPPGRLFADEYLGRLKIGPVLESSRDGIASAPREP